MRMRPAPQSLAREVAWIFILLLILAAGNILVVRHIFGYSDNVAATVNIAGKMRMLSQKIAYGVMGASAGDPAMLDIARRDIEDFDDARHALLAGGVAFDMQVRPLEARAREDMERIGVMWQTYQPRLMVLEQGAGVAAGAGFGAGASVGDAAGSGINPVTLQSIAQQSADLLQETEALLATLVHEELNWRRTGMWGLYALFFLDIVVLLLAYGAFQRYVLTPLGALADYCKELGRGNYTARVSYPRNDEIGVLTRALNDSAIEVHALMKKVELEHESLRRAEALFQGVADNVAAGICVVLEDLSVRYANDTYVEMLGYPSAAAAYAGRVDVGLALADRQRFVALLRSYLRGDPGGGGHTFHVPREDGGKVVVEVFCSVMDMSGVRAVIVVVLDITYRLTAEAAARQASLVFESTSEAIVVTDGQGLILNVNPAFSVITGYAKEEVLGRNMNLLSSGRQDQNFYRAFWSALREEGRWTGDLWNRRKSGDEYAESLTINAVSDDRGAVHCYIGVFSDITKKKRSEASVWHQAHHDGLTGLANRQYFNIRLHEAIDHARRTGISMALILLDLDFFKDVNDTLGHDMGDELLRQISARLSDSVREGDTVARLGGDEFTLIIVDIAEASIIDRLVQNIMLNIAEPYSLGEHTARISASIGVSLCPEDGVEPSDLLKNADLAMYAAKAGGPNQYRRFEPSMRAAIAR